MFKRCLIAVVLLLFFMFTIVCFISGKQIHKIRRDPSVLMDKFYRYQVTNPEAAKRALLILLEQDSKFAPALQELKKYQGYAKTTIRKLKSYLPYYKFAASSVELEAPATQDNLSKPIQKLKSESYPINKSPTSTQKLNAQKKENSLNQEARLLNQYYIENQKNKDLAAKTLRKLGKKFPNSITVLKEQGFAAIKQNNTHQAIRYLTKAYQISKEPDLAMQLGYLYTCIHKNPTAYKYYQLASKSQDSKLSLEANKAMTNLSGLQIKAFPKPYFSETFFTPFTQSRFGLTVRPLLTRLGVEQNNKIKSREYFFLRRTDDNKSQSIGEISQIYEDDVQIEGIGIQISPLKNTPIVGFLEGGIAYDLVYRNRNLWRGDLRTGIMYYNQFGVPPSYYDNLTIGLPYFSDLYADSTYYTRYNNNVISGARTHQGIHLIQYHSMMLNAYLTGRVIVDTKRLFYNNFIEGGPGIAFIPTNRFNFQLRFEHLNGAYLPAGAIANPYRQYYANNLVQLLFYAKI